MTMRTPAEWEPQAATWLSWPRNPVTWASRQQAIEAFYVDLIQNIAQFQPVRILVPFGWTLPRGASAIWQKCKFEIHLHEIPTNDIWIRDYGPIYVKDSGETIAVKFEFNAWGAKFPPWDLDNQVALVMSRQSGHRLLRYKPILEGGAMEFDGQGLGMTTADCLWGPNRNSKSQQQALQDLICRVFGLSSLLVLEGGLHGDHTDGHIDNVARFIGPGKIVLCRDDNPNSPNYKRLKDCREHIVQWFDKMERTLELYTLPLPPQRELGDEILPASYMNYIHVNGGLFVPLYGCSQDKEAMNFFTEAFPKHKVIGLNCSTVIEEGGSLHCMSKHEPK